MGLLTGTPHSLRIQLVRAVLAGFVCGGVEWALFFTFVDVGQAVWVATLWAALCSILLNYLLCVNWVFRSRNIQRQWVELKIFLIIGVSGLGLNVLTTSTLHDRCGASPLLAKAAASVLVVIWAFTGKKLVLFSDRGAAADDLVGVTSEPISAGRVGESREPRA